MENWLETTRRLCDEKDQEKVDDVQEEGGQLDFELQRVNVR